MGLSIVKTAQWQIEEYCNRILWGSLSFLQSAASRKVGRGQICLKEFPEGEKKWRGNTEPWF